MLVYLLLIDIIFGCYIWLMADNPFRIKENIQLFMRYDPYFVCKTILCICSNGMKSQ